MLLFREAALGRKMLRLVRIHSILLSKNTCNTNTATLVGTWHILLLADSVNLATKPDFTKSAEGFCSRSWRLKCCAPPHPLQSVSDPQPLEVRVKITFHSVYTALSCEGLCSRVLDACSIVGGLIPICLWFQLLVQFFFFFVLVQNIFHCCVKNRLKPCDIDMYCISACPSSLVLLLLSAFGCY